MFADFIRHLRTTRGMTQATAANAAGIDASTIRRWECRVTEPPSRVLARYLHALGATAEERDATYLALLADTP